MEFTTEHQLVKDYVLLIKNGLKSIDDVPNLFNLKEAVQDAINN